MSGRITITAGGVSLVGELNESATATAVAAALPIEAHGNCWGAEIYFAIEVEADPETDARSEMEVGELAYWPPGRAFCIFFGPTPALNGDRPRAASDVNPIGRILDDVTVLKKVADGEKVRIEQMD